ncbi:MAG: M20 family metallopeptidase [Acidobacteriaceae bacterium]
MPEMQPKQLLKSAKGNREQMLAELRSLVEIESPSDDREAVNRAVDWVEEKAREMGPSASTRRHKQAKFGDHLEVRLGKPGGKAAVLLLGHLDTVWPMGTLARMPFKIEKKRVWGPGVLDMKSGVVMALEAVRMLEMTGGVDREVILLLVSDEEVGSESSRPLTEEIAQRCGAVLVLEPGQGLGGAAKTWRKGVGEYIVRIHGLASHSGVDFKRGQSAVIELAHQVLKIADFTDLKRGLTVNPGVIRGGTRSNVIAAYAECQVDVRIQQLADGARIEGKMRSLKPKNRHCRVEVEGGLNRPPMERTKGGLKLYAEARKIADELGFALKEEGTGGGSDGNFTAALGIPTLDGLGGVGEGAHAVHESILLEELPRRTALLAGLIQRV